MKYKIDIAGTIYTECDLQSANIERPLFDRLSIGNACEARMALKFKPKSEIPIMAEIKPYVFIDSDWKPLGTFYIDERSISSFGIMSVSAYDSMMKADRVWEPDQSIEFPLPMSQAVSIISQLMGVKIDDRTNVSSLYQIDYPANDMTMRDVLGYFGVANAGNLIITNENKFLLVPLVGSAPEETFYLVDENRNAITFGGVRILI